MATADVTGSTGGKSACPSFCLRFLPARRNGTFDRNDCTVCTGTVPYRSDVPNPRAAAAFGKRHGTVLSSSSPAFPHPSLDKAERSHQNAELGRNARASLTFSGRAYPLESGREDPPASAADAKSDAQGVQGLYVLVLSHPRYNRTSFRR